MQAVDLQDVPGDGVPIDLRLVAREGPPVRIGEADAHVVVLG